MKAGLLMRERLALSTRAFVEIAIWRLTQPMPGSTHRYKYRMAYSVDNACMLRYDHETGKGDHKHAADVEVPYRFTDLDTLRRDFWVDINERRKGL
jgi:hypothetical protein